MSPLHWIALHLAGTVTLMLAVLALPRILRSHRAPSGTIAWLLFMALVPYVAVPLYLTLGGRKLEKATEEKPAVSYRPSGGSPQEGPPRLAALLGAHGLPPARLAHSLRLHTSGEAAYAALVELIDGATQSLWVATYVLGDDEVARAIIERLAAKAREGVQVRLLVDGLGSFMTPRRVYQPIRDAGGEVTVFQPINLRLFRRRGSLRNHRKLAVADGREVLTGGMNLAGEYLGPEPMEERWKDLALSLAGEVVEDFCRMFAADWKYATERALRSPRLEGATGLEPTGLNRSLVQAVPSGPDVPGDGLYEAILQSCFDASQRIWVVTPYFVPDEMLFQGLVQAARRGVDVRVLVPEHSNHPVTDFARASYLRDLAAAGGGVWLFPQQMVHAKAALFDDTVAMVGSANMDVRSMRLNYEVMVFGYEPEMRDPVERWMRSMFSQSVASAPGTGGERELLEGVSRLFAAQL